MNLPKELQLVGRRILVTGAAGGIGAEVARIAASLGAGLVLTDRAPLQTLADELKDGGTEVTAAACDVTDRTAIERLVAKAGPIDGLAALAALCPWDDWTEPGWDEVFDRVMRVNLLGVMHFARACLPGMIERRRGRIVIVSSVAGRMGGLRASPHYVASKGGLNAFVKWLAQRGAPHDVLVNGVAPGATESGMTQGESFDLDRLPLGRMAVPREIAWPVAFLLTDAASYMSGAMLDVNGGVYMS